VQKREAFWRDMVIGDSGGMLYHGFLPPDSLDSPSRVSSSNYRVPGALALQFFFNRDSAFERKMNLFCMNGTNPNIFQTNIDHSYFDKYDITFSQAYLFYVNNKSVFLQNPVITWDNDPSQGENREGPAARPSFTAWPNPFNPEVRFVLELPGSREAADNAAVRIYGADGRLVWKAAMAGDSRGRLNATWQGRDPAGRPAASGIYFVSVFQGGKAWKKKIVLAK